MPLYALVMLFAMLVGFAAVLQIPGLEGDEIDLALIKLSIATFDPWFVGVIGAAGVLTALVPGSTILIAGSTLISTNIVRKTAPAISDLEAMRWAKLSVLLLTAVAVYFTLADGESIVAILIMGYSIVTQLFPALFASLLPRNPLTKEGAGAGIFVGVGTVAIVLTTGMSIATFFPEAPAAVKQINTGFIALTLNTLVALLVSAATPVVADRERF
jgi:SSS family solute:Na+ symporter